MGTRFAKAAMISRVTPASEGEQGPGDISMRFGLRLCASLIVIALFRQTAVLTPSCSKY